MTPWPVLGGGDEKRGAQGDGFAACGGAEAGGHPVAPRAIGQPGAINAALLAAAIVALSHREIRAARDNFRAAQTKKVAEAKLP